MTRNSDPHDFDPPTRREDALELLLVAVREQLETTQRLRKEGSDGFRAYRRRAYAAFAILTVAAGLALFLIWRQAENIQTERERSIRAQCVEQNQRHDQTIRTLDARFVVARRVATAGQIRQMRQSRQFTVALISALAPRHDCTALVRRSVRVK